MRKLTVVLVAAMILLAGCSGGGNVSPTDESETETTETPMDGTPTEGDNNTSEQDGADDITPLTSVNADNSFANATEFDLTVYNGSTQIDVLVRADNDTGQSLIQLGSPATGTETLYNSSDYVALQNSSTGEVQYGETGSNLGAGVGLGAAFTILQATAYVGVVEWEQTGTTTVHGEDALVFESDSLNQTALNSGTQSPQFEQSDVQSVDSQMVIRSDGRIQTIDVQIETSDGTYGTDMVVSYQDITITQPDWVDESEAP